jgi:hypothetical protein
MASDFRLKYLSVYASNIKFANAWTKKQTSRSNVFLEKLKEFLKFLWYQKVYYQIQKNPSLAPNLS